MGDRVSIRFVKGGDTGAPVLFSHWGGRDFAQDAQAYADLLSAWAATKPKGVSGPLDRLEPRTVTVDFIYQMGRQNAHGERITGDLYLGVSELDGDNSDNGHFDIELGRVRTNVGPDQQDQAQDIARQHARKVAGLDN